MIMIDKEKDLIHVRVNDGLTENDWTDYALSVDAFDYIKPILEECEHKEPMKLVDRDDENGIRKDELLKSIIPAVLMAQSEKRHDVVYNVDDKPKDKTLNEVVNYYRHTGFLLVKGKRAKTEIIKD